MNMGCTVKTKAAKAYTRRVLIAMGIYAFILFASEFAIKRLHPNFAATLALAVLPSLPVIAVLAIIAIYLREERDEFQRLITGETLLWCMGGTLAVCTMFGFSEQWGWVPHFPAYWAFILFWFFTGAARMVYSVRFPEVAGDE